MNESKEESKSKLYYERESIKGLSFINLSNNSNSSSQENEDNVLYELLPTIKESQFHYFCQKCHNFPTLEFVDYSNILYSCFCIDRQKFLIKDFFCSNNKICLYKDNNESNNINNLNNKEKIYQLRCFKHKKIKGYKYRYYCLECKVNICEECWTSHVGECHELFLFNSLNQCTINKIKEISSILGRKKKILKSTNLINHSIYIVVTMQI